ncbi:IS1595 family transposase [Aurantiacibacter zhengii]|uniref:IS1595 family transposase n=1 Tax=Aurantiacibacter zhengii TaxID=2307003 RepID=A0A418NQV2_9SPHN|nr:IS1595 family transposase [Aurantiacibacter zhengii]RIV85189.1 IS1595 family transposase [Aurantiacibacter zhengii]
MTFAGTSVMEFFERFPDEQACLEHVFNVRFGDHSPCPNCGEVGGWAPIRGTKKYLHRCRRHVSVLQGTMFYRSNLSLMAWFYALLLFANSSTGMRASFLRRHLGIGVKSSHRMSNAIRAHMAAFEPCRQVGGPGKLVHIDEALIRHVTSGVRQTPHIVLGIECEGEVVSGLIADRSLASITAAINALVRPDSIIVTDCHLAYSSLASGGWEHIPINHARAFHNFAGLTNNPIEVYWSVLKRTLRLYNRIAPHNLWRFLAEIQFRYNRRKAKRSTFLELVGAFPPIAAERGAAVQETFDWSRWRRVADR